MVSKKSSRASLENKKSLFVLLGFVLVLSLVFIALEWSKSDIKRYAGIDFNKAFEPDVDIPQTIEKTLPPPMPPAPVAVIEQIKVVENTAQATDIDFSSEIGKNDGIVIGTPVPVVEKEDESDVPFKIVEKMPEFKGNVFKFLSENVKYPVVAIENEIQGKVICEFVVNRDGSIVDVVVLRGVHPSLDKEAVRVIKTMPNWNPGMQRGKPVRVKFTLPVSFKLMQM